jgi:transcriptional regulator with XRE-family HTH domain
MMDDYSDSAATFGDRLALAREAQGMDQGQLARRLGIRRQTVEAWEADRSEPRANRLQMLAGLLNVSLVWLMTGEGEGGPVVGAAPAAPTSAVGEVVAELRDLRLEQTRLTDRMAMIEKRLKTLAAG